MVKKVWGIWFVYIFICCFSLYFYKKKYREKEQTLEDIVYQHRYIYKNICRYTFTLQQGHRSNRISRWYIFYDKFFFNNLAGNCVERIQSGNRKCDKMYTYQHHSYWRSSSEILGTTQQTVSLTKLIIISQ